MDIVQTFYDNMATDYDKLFADWEATTMEQALLLEGIFGGEGFDKNARILDCACGIGTQAIGLAARGWDVTASDISEAELEEARRRAADRGAVLNFRRADFCALGESFGEKFDIIICMDKNNKMKTEAICA